MTQRACDHPAVFQELPRLRLLSLARSLPRNFVCFRHGAYCGLTRGGPLAAEKPSPHRNPQLRLPRKNPLTHQSKFASCSNNAASAPSAILSPSRRTPGRGPTHPVPQLRCSPNSLRAPTTQRVPPREPRFPKAQTTIEA